MKRNKILLFVILISLLPFSFVNGQEQKIERKIKVIVADKPGTEVIIDTTLSSNYAVDSIKLKDGTIIYLGQEEMEDRKLPGSVKKKILITSACSKPGMEKEREITVISSDSLELQDFPEQGEVKEIVINNSGNHKEKQMKQYIYVNENKDIRGKDADRSNVYSVDNESDQNIDRTKYIIAKNGIVVTIEGNDEATIKELMKDIEKKIDSKSEKTTNVADVQKADNKKRKRN
jgi:hypothetical protein